MNRLSKIKSNGGSFWNCCSVSFKSRYDHFVESRSTQCLIDQSSEFISVHWICVFVEFIYSLFLSVDVHQNLIRELPMTVGILQQLDSSTRELFMKDRSLTSSTFKQFSLNQFKYLESLTVGDRCCPNVTTFSLVNFQYLKTIRIGSNSFTNCIDRSGNDSNKKFTISSCLRLTSVVIGRYSFSDYAGSFAITDCNSLSSLEIGALQNQSLCFYGACFTLNSKGWRRDWA